MTKFILFGDRAFLTSQVNAWIGIREHIAAFGSAAIFGTDFMGSRVLTPGEVATGFDLPVCIQNNTSAVHSFSLLVGSGVAPDRIVLADQLIDKLAESGQIQPATWRVVKQIPRPEKLRLEVCSLCQLDCASCYMRNRTGDVFGKGFLKFTDFKKILDDAPFLKTIELSNNGEIFLNPELEQILKYAYEKEVVLTAEGGVNFNDVTPAVMEAMVKYQLHDLTIAADGATNDTYPLYRRKGDINKVYTNLERLLALKQEYHSEYPRIHWQYIIMESSEPDIEKAIEIANKYGIDIFFKLTWDRSYVPRDPERIQRLTGLKYLTRDEFENGTGEPYGLGRPVCFELFEAPRVNWDGRLFGCCAQHYGDLNCNVLEVGLENALQTAYITYSKKMLCGELPEPESAAYIPCVRCRVWKQMKNGGWRFWMEDA